MNMLILLGGILESSRPKTYLAPTRSWLPSRSRASWEKSFTPGWENSDTHGLNAEPRGGEENRGKRGD